MVMACGNDNFRIQSKKYHNVWYKIPCRYCINCRVDRRKEWADRCQYEFKKYISGTFLTLTYDDNHLFSECLVKGNDNKLRCSLKYNHIKSFNDSLRYWIKKHEEYQNILMNPDFKYLGVGEYGENGSIFDRCHFHILYFGLDFKYCEKLFKEIWEHGNIYSLPILKGGINYVLKYMDKQIMGKNEIFEAYKRYRLERPKQFQSKSLGSELYYSNYENAKKNNGIIQSGMKKIFIPPYYKNKMELWTNENEQTREKIKMLWEYNERIDNPELEFNEKERLRKKILMNEKIQVINERKLRNLYSKMLNAGEPVFNEYNLNFS